MKEDAFFEQYSCFGITYFRRKLLKTPAMLTRHRHNVGEIVFALEGESLITCSNQIVNLKAPFIAFYPAGVVHEQYNSGSEYYARWCFPLFPMDIDGSTWIPDHFFAVSLGEEPFEQLASYVKILYAFWGKESEKPLTTAVRTSEADRFRLKHLLLLFLNELKPLVPPEVLRENSYVNDICCYIADHLRERLTIDTLTNQFFVGRTKLTKDFRRTMSMTVVEFITTVRVNHAKTMLQDSYSLKEIADQCGFSSLPYFIKVFTNHTGLSPTQYRTALDEQQPE